MTPHWLSTTSPELLTVKLEVMIPVAPSKCPVPESIFQQIPPWVRFGSAHGPISPVPRVLKAKLLPPPKSIVPDSVKLPSSFGKTSDTKLTLLPAMASIVASTEPSSTAVEILDADPVVLALNTPWASLASDS